MTGEFAACRNQCNNVAPDRSSQAARGRRGTGVREVLATQGEGTVLAGGSDAPDVPRSPESSLSVVTLWGCGEFLNCEEACVSGFTRLGNVFL